MAHKQEFDKLAVQPVCLANSTVWFSLFAWLIVLFAELL